MVVHPVVIESDLLIQKVIITSISFSLKISMQKSHFMKCKTLLSNPLPNSSFIWEHVDSEVI